MTSDDEIFDPIRLAETIGRAQSGDEEAMERLLRHASIRARPYLRAFTGRRSEDLADLRQQVLMEVWRSIRVLSDPGRFEFWLAGIVRNRGIDHLRRRYRHSALRTVLKGEDLDELLARRDTDPRLAALRRELQQQIRVAIESLAEPYREVLTLRYLEGASLAEIAELKRKPAGTVRSICTRGKRMISQRLEAPE